MVLIQELAIVCMNNPLYVRQAAVANLHSVSIHYFLERMVGSEALVYKLEEFLAYIRPNRSAIRGVEPCNISTPVAPSKY